MISVILLAGGIGSRMKMSTPKQFLLLKNKPVILFSAEIFLSHPEVKELIVVCDPTYSHFFSNLPVLFAKPGPRRQDSLFNGLEKVCADTNWVCIHDAARPFIKKANLDTLFQEGKKWGAATFGTPLKWTVKEIDLQGMVKKTLNRESLWEIQTPQFLSKQLLEKGFAFANEKSITVTDDVALAELLDHPVKIIPGEDWNIKLTTPFDLKVAECISTNF